MHTAEPKIKICGLSRIEDIEMVNQFPISYVGFIFAEKSPRYVAIEKAKILRSNLRKDIQSVGVFTNTSIIEVNKMAEAVGLDIIQLHSQETNEDCKKAVRPVWKMIAVQDKESAGKVIEFPDAQGILFDTYHKELLGGSGKVFSWEVVKEMPKSYFTILAGGLTPENIKEAAEAVKPQVLDVNSGVETNGKKDKIKLEKLIRRLYI